LVSITCDEVIVIGNFVVDGSVKTTSLSPTLTGAPSGPLETLPASRHDR
jgi:hypothetical protein